VKRNFLILFGDRESALLISGTKVPDKQILTQLSVC